MSVKWCYLDASYRSPQAWDPHWSTAINWFSDRRLKLMPTCSTVFIMTFLQILTRNIQLWVRIHIAKKHANESRGLPRINAGASLQFLNPSLISWIFYEISSPFLLRQLWVHILSLSNLRWVIPFTDRVLIRQSQYLRSVLRSNLAPTMVCCTPWLSTRICPLGSDIFWQ